MSPTQIVLDDGPVVAPPLEYIHLCDGCCPNQVGEFYCGSLPGAHTLCEWCRSRPGIHILFPRVNQPFVSGRGPSIFSTSLELVYWKPVKWDTNRYYAALGVSTDATRAEIKDAYIRLDGQNSDRLTSIIKVLLDPIQRAIYDAVEIGHFYYDYEMETMVRNARIHRVSELRKQGRIREAEDEEAANASMDEGVTGPFETVDKSVPGEQDSPAPRSDRWPWAFYLWRAKEDTSRLSQWQELLISALGGRKEHLELAVGLVGRMAQPYEVVKVGFRVVAFLRFDVTPTSALAEQAADRVVASVHQSA